MDKIDLATWEDWDKLSENTAKFILEQAEKNLDATVETAKILTDRAVNLLQFSIPSLAIITGLLYSDLVGAKPYLFWLALWGIVILMAVTFLAFVVYDLQKVETKGNTPENLLSQEKVDSEKQYLMFLVATFETTQNSITANITTNETRTANIRYILTIIKIGIVGAVLLPFLISLLLPDCHP